MKYGDPLNAMAKALYSALNNDLPDIEYIYREPPHRDKASKEEMRKRRPNQDYVNVIQFPQEWSSTALGFGGVGGAAMCSADTTIIESEDACVAVYFAGRFAYRIKRPNQKFWEDVGVQQLVSVAQHAKYERKDHDKQIKS